MIRKLAYLAVFCAGPVMAQEALVDCTSPQTTVDMRICAGISLRAADEDLNVAYGRAVVFFRDTDAYLPDDAPKGEDLLRTAQRAWIPFRDAACASEASLNHGGTIQPIIEMSCLEQMTRDRTAALIDLISEY